MGVINITPDSFSDGGEFSHHNFQEKLLSFSTSDAIDLGAESTAPMNESISWETEWERLKPNLGFLKKFPGVLSFDTYHPETLEEIMRFYLDHGFEQDLIWNDVSGKFDHSVHDFLSISDKFHYVYCHNLAPKRELSGRHMDYVDPGLSLESLRDYFGGFKQPQVIFDPCLGFSKNYAQNWMILENFAKLAEMVGHDRWLLGFSRKSFLRKKYDLTLEQKSELDQKHVDVLKDLKLPMSGEVWIRTHRPDLL